MLVSSSKQVFLFELRKDDNIMKNNIITNSAAALNAVLAELHLRRDDIDFCKISLNDGLYEIKMLSAWVRYDCYVDSYTGVVLGIDTQPILCRTAEPHAARLEFLRSDSDFSA